MSSGPQFVCANFILLTGFNLKSNVLDLHTATLLSLHLLASDNILYFKFTLHSPHPHFEAYIDGLVSIYAFHFDRDLILILL
jgi:hypothetical protein